jgi:hypothetical protein
MLIKKCSYFKDKGIENSRNIVTVEEEERICPMSDGIGVRSY